MDFVPMIVLFVGGLVMAGEMLAYFSLNPRYIGWLAKRPAELFDSDGSAGEATLMGFVMERTGDTLWIRREHPPGLRRMMVCARVEYTPSGDGWARALYYGGGPVAFGPTVAATTVSFGGVAAPLVGTLIGAAVGGACWYGWSRLRHAVGARVASQVMAMLDG